MEHKRHLSTVPNDTFFLLLVSNFVVKALLEANADVNVQDNDLMTPLHHAVVSGSIEVVECLLKKDAKVNAANRYCKAGDE
jgi:ankyrin repeat protein